MAKLLPKTLIVLFILFFILHPLKIAAQLRSDTNNDGKIDGLDYMIWRNNYNKIVTNGAISADFNLDGKVDGLDYLIWLTDYKISAVPSPTLPYAPYLSSTPQPTITPLAGSEILFTPSTADFANPERGFMNAVSIWPNLPFDPNQISPLRSSDTVVLVNFRLDNFRDPRDAAGVTLSDYQCQPIDSTALSRIAETFKTARNKGLKLVYRFAYNWDQNSVTDPTQASPDVPIECVRLHLDALKQILSENADVTLAAQIGFAGIRGEWHGSKYLSSQIFKKEIIDRFLSILPADRMLQIRYPLYKQIFFQGPLTLAQAFRQSSPSRIGHHNDCFLSGTDDATYKSTIGSDTSALCIGQDEVACWKNFISTEGQFTPIGGQSCLNNPPRSQCTNSLLELETLHWSFINSLSNQDVLNSWTQEGCMPEIRLRLGYRFELTEALIPQQVNLGGSLYFTLKLKNTGFANLFNPRPVYLVLFADNRYEIPLSSVDPRYFRSGLVTNITINVNLPQNITPGTYKLGLWLPDAYPSLKNNSAYAVRFANPGIWDATTGINILTDNLKIVP